MNTKKTKFSLFHPEHKKKNLCEKLPTLKIDNTEIKREKVTRFLGILIDENLTWKPHIESANTKVSKSIGVLYRIRNLLNKALMKQLYYSFTQSYLNYGKIVWGSK